jgi:hypothetical protein
LVELPVLALWFVCGLGAVVLAAVAPHSRTQAVVGMAGFAIGAWWARQPFAPTTAGVAIVAALVAGMELVRPQRQPLAIALAGLLAGTWSAVMQRQGLPVVAAIAVAAALPAMSVYLRTRRPAFAPPALREEALLFLVALGVTAAAAPGIVEGWRAAGTLNLQIGEAEAAGSTAMPTWTVVVASAALVTGGLFSLWSRR